MLLRRFLGFIHDHQVLSWLGVAIGVVGLSSSFAAEGTGIAVLLAVVGWGLAGLFGLGLLGAYIVQPSHTVECMDCQKRFALRGPRGEEAESYELMRLRAHFPADSFMYSRIQMAGDLAAETLRYRNLGKNGRATDREFVTLGAQHVAYADPDLATKIVHIMPPGGIRRGDVFEIEAIHSLEGSFSSDRESVGKNVLFPVKKMRFEIDFFGGDPENCTGQRILNDSIKELSAVTPTYVDGAVRLTWEVSGAKADDRYRVGWDWAG